MLRTVNDQPTLWDAILPAELLVLPAELGRVDVLLDDPVFFAPFATYFDTRIGRVAFRHRRACVSHAAGPVRGYAVGRAAGLGGLRIAHRGGAAAGHVVVWGILLQRDATRL